MDKPRPNSFRVYEQKIVPEPGISDPRDAMIDKRLIHTWRWSAEDEESD